MLEIRVLVNEKNRAKSLKELVHGLLVARGNQDFHLTICGRMIDVYDSPSIPDMRDGVFRLVRAADDNITCKDCLKKIGRASK